MTSPSLTEREYERVVTGWLQDRARVTVPDGLLAATLQRTTDMRRGRGQLAHLRFPSASSFARLGWIVIAVALIGALAVVMVGSRPHLPPPIGLAENGSVAFSDGDRIVLVGSDGSITNVIGSEGDRAIAPAFSPDGTRLAYLRPSGGNMTAEGKAETARYDLVIAASDGSRPIVVETDGLEMSTPSWSPDGTALTYSRVVDPQLSLDQVFVVPSDGSAWPRAIGDPSTANWQPRFSPDGSRIAYFRGTEGVFVMRPDGREIDGLTTVFFGKLDWLDWSPDGTRIAFSGAQWSETDLWLVGLDGAQEIAVTDNHNGQTRASWSPDGSRLAYLTDNGTGQARLVVADAQGGNPVVQPGTWHWVTPVWSPDGMRIAVAGDGPAAMEPSLQLVDPNGRLDPIAISGAPESISWQRVAP